MVKGIFLAAASTVKPKSYSRDWQRQYFIIATKNKLNALDARPLITDTGDSELDMELSGYLPVITGYNDQVLYPVASPQ